MKFLCTKVKPSWLTSDLNKQKVISAGLLIREAFVGIEIKGNEPTVEENELTHNAINNLFGSHIKAFPVRLINL